ncbi:hypothetical protein MKW92_016086 [Papaver armeniacum]|nr:hypothetical protein MKW92_016086 [Papaver armeniacum]
MAATRELVSDDQAMKSLGYAAKEIVLSDDHQEMVSLGPQQVESHRRLEAKFDVLLTVLTELKVNTSQIVRNTSKNDEQNHKAVPNPSSSSVNPLAEDGGQATNKDVLDEYKELYDAAIEGDWKVASKFLEKHPEGITKGITNESQTVLHVAIRYGKKWNLMFIEEILKLMPPHTLEHRTNVSENTTLHYAAICGHAKAAKMIVNKNPRLTQIVNRSGMVPLERALTSVTAGQRETVEYLYSVTKHEHPGPFSGDQGDSLLRHMIVAGFYDIASSIVQRFPELVIDQTKKVQTNAMNYMAERPFAFVSGAKHTFWQRCIYSLVKVNTITTYELHTQANENKNSRRSEESLTQCSEGIKGDEENPVERIEGSCRDENFPSENSKNMEGDKAKPFKWEAAGVGICASIFMICLQMYCKIKLFWLWLFISVTPIEEFHKQLYDEKVKHKQAEDLVKSIFTPIKEKMNPREVKYFFAGSNVMKMAIRHGSVEFVDVCIQLFPYIIRNKMGGQTMIQMSIEERNETILNLLCKHSGKEKIDVICRADIEGNTILHYAAKLAPFAQLNLVRGAYLQMQREVQWFKGVENMISEQMKFKRNKKGETAHNIFTKEHKELKENGEKWLKDTSGSCMLVAALIATVAFASAFTVPGGNISDSTDSSKNGIPVFLGKNSFIVFALADAIALFSSVTSVLMFLAVYTSRYAEIDFLKSLPNKLMLGLATLFISMASVLVAFGASIYIVLGERLAWALVPIVVFSCVPVTLFALLQLPLFFDMVHSTYQGSLFREHTYISSLQLNARKED